MLKFFRIFLGAAFIFSFGAMCSAATVGISNDGLETFMEKCNVALKTNDAEGSLDTPKLFATYKYYTDTLQISDTQQIKVIYTVRDDKIYSIKLTADNYDDTVKSVFEGMNIVYLKALGLTEDEAKGLTNSGTETEWQKDGLVTRLNKKFIVSMKNSTLTITAASVN